MKRKPAQVIPFHRPGTLEAPSYFPPRQRELFAEVQREMLAAGVEIEPVYLATILIAAEAAHRVETEWPKFQRDEPSELGEVQELMRQAGASLLLPDSVVERFLCLGHDPRLMSPATTN
jgi:hypothetical protein